MIDINHKANRLVLRHLRLLEDEIEQLLQQPSSSGCRVAAQKKNEARDIYLRSNMAVPAWCDE